VAADDVVTVLNGTNVLERKWRRYERVLKEFCYGKAETLVDVEEAAKGGRDNVL
jgi:hypothetical protein